MDIADFKRRKRKKYGEDDSRLGWTYRIGITSGLLLVVMLGVAATTSKYAWLISAAFVLIWLIAAIWSARLILHRSLSVVISPIGIPLAVLAVYCVARFILSLPNGLVAGRADFWMTMSCILFLFLVMNIIRRRWQLRAVLAVMTVLGGALALLAVADFAGGQALPRWLGGKTSPGSLTDTIFPPNHLASLVELIIPILAAAVCLTRIPGGIKILLLCACILLLEAIGFSFARAGWISVAVGLLTLLALLVRQGVVRPRWVPVILVALALAAGVGLTSAPVVRERLGQVMRGGDPVRWNLWNSALEMGAKNPVLGVGPGMFAPLYPQFHNEVGSDPQPTAMSDWLQLFAEYGAVGAGLVIWILATLLVSSARIIKRWKIKNLLWYKDQNETRGTRHALMVGMIAAAVTVAVHSLLDSSLHAPGPALLLAFIVGIGMASGRRWGRQRQQDGVEPEDESDLVQSVHLHTKGSLALGVTMLAVSLFALSWTGRALVASTFTRLADKRRIHSDNPEHYRPQYERAWKWDKGDITPAVRLGEDYLQAANSALALGETEKAKTLATQASHWFASANQLMPLWASNWIAIADANEIIEDDAVTLLAYKKAFALEPRNADFHIKLAKHYQSRKKIDLAIEQLRRAVEIEGGDGEAAKELKKLESELSPPPSDSPENEMPNTTTPEPTPPPNVPAIPEKETQDSSL